MTPRRTRVLVEAQRQRWRRRDALHIIRRAGTPTDCAMSVDGQRAPQRVHLLPKTAVLISRHHYPLCQSWQSSMLLTLSPLRDASGMTSGKGRTCHER